MDVLISLGTNASYFYSLISILHHRFSVRDSDLTSRTQLPLCATERLDLAYGLACPSHGSDTAWTICTYDQPPHVTSPLRSVLFPTQHHMSGMYLPTDFFETCAMLITFVLLGKYLEAAVSEGHFHA